MSGNDLRNKIVLRRWRKTVKEGDDWMSSGRELQKTDAARICCSTEWNVIFDSYTACYSLHCFVLLYFSRRKFGRL